MTKNKLKARITIRLSADDLKWLQDHAQGMGGDASVADVMRVCIADYRKQLSQAVPGEEAK